MNNFTLDANKARGWIYKNFGHVRERRGGAEITVPSPFPKKDGKEANQHKEQLWINLEKDMWRCWASDESGSFARLVHLLDGIDFAQARMKYYENGVVPSESPLEAIKKLSGHKRERHDIQLPTGCVPVSAKTTAAAYEYLAGRGMPDSEIFKLLFCCDGAYTGYVIIPFYDKRGDIVFWQGRSINEKNDAKYVNPPKDQTKKGNIIYTEDWDMSGHPVFIVEGFFDAKALELIGLHGVATLGAAITPAQAAIIAGAGATDVVVAMDTDCAGQSAVVSMQSALRNAGIGNVMKASPPAGSDWWDYYSDFAAGDEDNARKRITDNLVMWTASTAFSESVQKKMTERKPTRKEYRDKSNASSRDSLLDAINRIKSG